jgi:putative FmdB family regulatory protein
MPTYDYECSKCRKTFEAFQSMKDAPYTVCPRDKCRMKTWGKGKVRRLLGSGAGLIFKGSGFYITDYRSEGYKTSAKKDAAPPASSGGGSDQGSGGKSASTPAEPAKTPKKSPKKD